MTKVVTCLARVAFTRFVDGYGMVHGDPESSLDEARNPDIPEQAVAALVSEKVIEAPDGWDAEPEKDEEKPAKAAKQLGGAPA